jgi:hypothetical protein
MFDKLAERGAALAARAAERRREDLAEGLRNAAPRGVTISEAPEGVLLSGRALRLRFALEPALRWLTAVVR